MDAHTLKVLEFPRVLERLAAHASNSLGREAALDLVPSTYPEIVSRRLQETREARHLLDMESGMPLGGLRDIREAVTRASIEQTLLPVDLLDIAQTVASGRRLRTVLLRSAERCPLLAEIAGNIPPLPGLDTQIEQCIAENGDIRDSASAELARTRDQKRISHGRLMDRLNRMLGSDKLKTALQENLVTVREDRYCLPVKSEHRSQVPGIVHDASASGATVFIEPGSCVELGNEIKELAIKEEQEIARILARLSGLVAASADDLRTMLAMAANLDLANAKALLAGEMHSVEPVTNRLGKVRLVRARHPLLAGNVVPIDIEVGGDFQTLLITGPNTGGKTVAIKTIGLFCLMVECGLQVPADETTEIALFDQVFADIGDEQDIRQSLSTFSAHLTHIVSILKSLGTNSLILLDEIGAGTDPAEGAALAKALLNAMRARGARVVATTHYGELKEFAYATPGVENAAVEFDRETLRPTYRVLQGVPGSSHAFYIAGRLGLESDIVDEARANLSARDKDTAELLQQIEASRGRTYEMERQAHEAKEEANAARTEYERRVGEVADVQRTVRRDAETEARAVLRRATEKAENILDELRKMNRGSRKGTTARRGLAELRSEVATEFDAPEAPEAIEVPAGGYGFKKGDRVRIVTLGADGVLLADPTSGEAAVQIGAMRATLPLNVLRPSTAPAEAKPKRSSAASDLSMRKAIHIAPEIILRAMRVDEAEPLLEKYLDDAYVAGIGSARIIHGKGTGALRRFVWDFLKVHPVVGGYRLGDESEGGDGATVVEFKQ